MTPVIGTIMVLAITMLGIAGIMMWGAPTLQSIQDRNTVLAMEGEFLEVRAGTLALMIDKASRNPEINLQEGDLQIVEGTRFLIAEDGTNEDCDFIISDWEVGANTFTVAQQDDLLNACPLKTKPKPCDTVGAEQYCLRLASVVGNNLGSQAITIAGPGPYTVTLPGGADISAGDWSIRIEDNSGNPLGQAWILSTDQLAWRHSSSVGTYELFLEGGAIFETRDGRTFLVKPPAIQEGVFGANDLFVRMPSYLGDRGGVSEGLAPNVFIGQVGNNHLRTSVAESTGVRFSFFGNLATPWCETLLLRNSNLDPDGYANPAGISCDDEVPTVVYGASNPTPFPFELIHARITTRITT